MATLNTIPAAAKPLELNVLVVGGGIAGLAAAVALSRAGHRVTVCFGSYWDKKVFPLLIRSSYLRNRLLSARRGL